MKRTKLCLKICGIALLVIIIGTFAILYIGSGGYPVYVEFSNKSGSSGEYAELLLPIKSSEVQIVRHSLWGAPWGVDLVYENGKLSTEFFYNKPFFAIGMMFIIFRLPAFGLSYIAVIITIVIDVSKGT